MAEIHDDAEQFYAPDRTAWRGWLSQNHATRSEGVWLVFYKKLTGKPTLTYDESVEEALCFGWIDSLPRKLDDQRHMLWFTPRKPKSVWSKVNKARLPALEANGWMTDAGRAAIELAKANGAWSAIDQSENLVVPDDLATAFAANETARDRFDSFAPSARRGILQWIGSAKRAETKRKRIEETVTLAQQNIKANFPRDKSVANANESRENSKP